MSDGIKNFGFIATEQERTTGFFQAFEELSDFARRYPDIEIDYIGFDARTIAAQIYDGQITTPVPLFTMKNGNKLLLYYRSSSPGEIAFATQLTSEANPVTSYDNIYIALTSQYSWARRNGWNIEKLDTMFMKRSDGLWGLGTVGIYEKYGERYIDLVWQFYSGAFDTAIKNLFINQPTNIDDPYVSNDNQTPSGGYGDFDYTSETELPPSLPSLSAANAGFVTLWNPTISEVGNLADYLWGPSFSVASWQKLWNDPMECLLSLGIVPVAPTTGTRANIFFGNADTGIESTPITTQFVKVDMGSMRINGQSASYMDYAPYAKASIYLPYCGTYALDVDEIMDADLALEYHIDIYTGACVAYLTINNRTNSDGSTVHNVMYQFTGNCLASIPVTSGDHSQLLQSLLFMGASIAATVATAGAGAASGGAIEGLAAEGDVVASSGVLGAATAGSAINTVMSMKPNVMHSGNLSSTAGLLGDQTPYVTFTWSNLCRPDDEYQLVGMPIQKSGTLSDFEGFTIVSACHMDNILCTDAERSMIEQALGRGVII